MSNPVFLNGITVEQLAEALAPKLLRHKPNPIPETLLSKKEVTELLGITINTLSKYTKNGTIPAYGIGIGSRVLYKRSEVLESLIRINK
jgi:excisionase family DNA binding protein